MPDMKREAFVKQFQQQLAKQFNIGYQKWWSQFLFHFSDISNIISILNCGKLYSRNKALELGVMENDNADDEVIDNTTLNAKDYVRFYFGALTPTQFHNEGFKPKDQILHNAHCPVPVFLLFDFVKLLSREDSQFSSGNIASSDTDIYTDIEDLNRLEFEYIYHRGYIQDDDNKRHITYCRHAEVLIPDEVDIYDYLSYVIVRSEAEKETLLNGLNGLTKQSLDNKIRIYTNGIFYANRFYVERVLFQDNIFSIEFSRTTQDKFNFDFEISDMNSGFGYAVNAPNISLESEKVTLKIKPEYHSANLSLKILIDGNLAYKNNFIQDENIIF